MEQIEDTEYSKVLIGKYNVDNGCHAPNGAILTVVPKKEVKNKGHIAHYFIDSLNRKIKSKYGWVRCVESFTLRDFITRYGTGSEDGREIEHIKIMLDSIARLPEDTPVAATYSERGIETKRMDFTVHKVFFYKK